MLITRVILIYASFRLLWFAITLLEKNPENSYVCSWRMLQNM